MLAQTDRDQLILELATVKYEHSYNNLHASQLQMVLQHLQNIAHEVKKTNEIVSKAEHGVFRHAERKPRAPGAAWEEPRDT
jgi:hypothetical protein